MFERSIRFVCIIYFSPNRQNVKMIYPEILMGIFKRRRAASQKKDFPLGEKDKAIPAKNWQRERTVARAFTTEQVSCAGFFAEREERRNV